MPLSRSSWRKRYLTFSSLFFHPENNYTTISWDMPLEIGIFEIPLQRGTALRCLILMRHCQNHGDTEGTEKDLQMKSLCSPCLRRKVKSDYVKVPDQKLFNILGNCWLRHSGILSAGIQPHGTFSGYRLSPVWHFENVNKFLFISNSTPLGTWEKLFEMRTAATHWSRKCSW